MNNAPHAILKTLTLKKRATLLVTCTALLSLAAAPAFAQNGTAAPSAATTLSTKLGVAPTAVTTTTTTVSPSGVAPLPGNQPALGNPPGTQITTETVALPVGGGLGAPGLFAPGGAPGMLTGPGTPGLLQSPQTPQIVQDAVSRLQRTDAINLDDMIKAQDAINRLDLLLEIEKRQTELKKLRDERNKPITPPASAMMAALNLPPIRANGAMPEAALNLPPKPLTPAAPPPSASAGYSVRRIFGTDGRYSAVVNTDDKARTVREGDELPDGSKVKQITLTSVTTLKSGKSKVLTIPSDAYIVRDAGN